MKRITTILIALVIAMLLLAGCGAEEPIEEPTLPAPTPEELQEPEADPLQVITTVFPQYDFVRQITGGRVELSMLISPGAETHAFEPTARDIVALNDADLLIYVGGHDDLWIGPILASLDTEIHTLALLDFVEAIPVGHDHHHDHHHHHDDCDDDDCDDEDHHHHHGHHHHDDDCDDDDCDDEDHHHHHGHHHHDDDCDDDDCDDEDHHHHHGHHHHDDDCDDDDHHHHDHDHHHGEHLDEHVWTSPRNAILIVEVLTETLAELDPANADFFRENAVAYIEELRALDAAFAEMVAQGVRDTVIFGDRFPFLYLMEAYGLTAHAAFPGCTAETQASPATIAFLIEKVNAEDIPIIFYLEFSNQLIANVIAEATGARLLELHSAHNVSHADFTAGLTYVEIMMRNLEHLREALS